MSNEELKKLLEITGMPVAYRDFKESQKMPFICYFETGTNNFAADGKVYFSSRDIQIELYTRHKDSKAEKKVEDVLSEIFWQKKQEYIDSEKCYQTVYEIEV